MMHPDHDIHSEREFPVARETLFAAFSDPAMLAKWWGPRGSVNAFDAFELRPGGAWRFVLQTSDGTAYPMIHEFIAVEAPEHVALRHLQAGHTFELDMCYDAIDDRRTRLRWRMRFEDAAEAARVRTLVAEANEQNFDRLEAALGLPSSSRPKRFSQR
jgi:uncharacterized protein YndB with AHSA1/START domain